MWEYLNISKEHFELLYTIKQSLALIDLVRFQVQCSDRYYCVCVSLYWLCYFSSYVIIVEFSHATGGHIKLGVLYVCENLDTWYCCNYCVDTNKSDTKHYMVSELVLRIWAELWARLSEMATSNIASSKPFDFSRSKDWPKWICQFERFRQASNLCIKSDASQVNTLIYHMGHLANDLLRLVRLTGA